MGEPLHIQFKLDRAQPQWIGVIRRPGIDLIGGRADSPEHFISLSKEWPQLLISSRVGLRNKLGFRNRAEPTKHFILCNLTKICTKYKSGFFMTYCYLEKKSICMAK
jgi:hypothetical protein